MATKPPNRNLPPAAAPWARWAEDNIKDLQTSDQQSAQGLRNSLKAINGSLNALGTTQATLAQQQSQLTTAVNTIADQQTLLTNFVTVVNQQSVASNYSIPTTVKKITSTTIAVPSGYDIATVTGRVQCTVQTSMSTAGYNYPWVNHYIGVTTAPSNIGNSGNGMPLTPSPASGVFMDYGFTSVIGLSGMTTPGVTVNTIEVAYYTYTSGYTVSANSNNQTILDVNVMFVKKGI